MYYGEFENREYSICRASGIASGSPMVIFIRDLLVVVTAGNTLEMYADVSNTFIRAMSCPDDQLMFQRD